MKYETWKNNLEAEFEEHRKANCRIVYSYQREYDNYAKSNEWVMVGDFCNFVRASALHKGEEITAKYEAILVDDIEVFEGFCKDDFERIRAWNNDNIEANAKKIFEYNNFSFRYEDLTEEQVEVFNVALAEHIEKHKDDIEMMKRFKEM